MTAHDGRRQAILAIDTATSRVVIATGSPDGLADGLSSWVVGHRHGETLLPAIGRFLGEQNIRRSRLVGIVVGSGPGAFTGLRVGMATAKGMAHGLRIPLVGVSTAEALFAAAEDNEGHDGHDGHDGHEGHEGHQPVLLLPAGSSDRVMIRPGQAPVLLAGGREPDLAENEILVAVDLDGRASPDALARGEQARDGLGQALLRLGAARLGAPDLAEGELATLVPEYVTLPRGAQPAQGSVEWSRDPR